MGSLGKTRTQFIVVVAVLGILDVLLIGYRFWPGSSQTAMAAQEQALKQQVQALEDEVKPLDGIKEKLDKTRVDVKKFYEEKVPGQFSQISQHLEKLVKDTGVSTLGIHYSQDKNDRNDKGDLADVQRIHIDTTVTGEYSKIAHFINAMEQDKFIFIIDQVSLTGQEGGVVSLQIRCETFLKET